MPNRLLLAIKQSWLHAKPMQQVFACLSLMLFFMLILPQSWTRACAHALNEFAFEQMNHTLLRHITEMGDAVFCGSIGLLVVAFRPDLFKRVLFVIIVATLMSNLLKGYFNYPRPPAVYGTDSVIGPVYKTRSFPSGHTLTAFIVTGFLWQIFRRAWIRTLTLGFAIAVGLSRVLLGVHWLTDVVFGAWLGWGAMNVLRVLFPTKHDIDALPAWLMSCRKRTSFNACYRWLSQPFAQRGNRVVVLLCGVLIINTVVQKPSDLMSLQVQRVLIATVWGAVILVQIYRIFQAWQRRENDTKATECE